MIHRKKERKKVGSAHRRHSNKHAAYLELVLEASFTSGDVAHVKEAGGRAGGRTSQHENKKAANESTASCERCVTTFAIAKVRIYCRIWEEGKKILLVRLRLWSSWF